MTKQDETRLRNLTAKSLAQKLDETETTYLRRLKLKKQKETVGGNPVDKNQKLN